MGIRYYLLVFFGGVIVPTVCLWAFDGSLTTKTFWYISIMICTTAAFVATGLFTKRLLRLQHNEEEPEKAPSLFVGLVLHEKSYAHWYRGLAIARFLSLFTLLYAPSLQVGLCFKDKKDWKVALVTCLLWGGFMTYGVHAEYL